MDDKGENYPDSERFLKRNHPKQPQINKMFIYDVENPNCTKIHYSHECPWLFPKEQKGYHQETRGTDQLYTDQYILKEVKAR